ncbi:hypothetical protein JCM3765_006585 [Sporobolomyces pararoseus]
MPSEPTPTTLSAEPGSTSQHFSLDVKFPVYSIAFNGGDSVVLAGGGGSSRTGVKNRLSMYKIDTQQKQLKLITEHELSKQEDAPMTIAIHRPSKTIAAGINSDLETLKTGKNENLRIFNYTQEDTSSTINFEKSKQTLVSTDPDHYQKVTCFSRSPNPLTPPLLAIGSTSSQLSLLALPNLNEVLPQLNPSYSSPSSSTSEGGEGVVAASKFYEGEEIFDVDFNDKGDMLVGTSSTKLCVWSTNPTNATAKERKEEKDNGQEVEEEEEEEFEPLQVIERPILKKELACTFRAAKFGRQSTCTNLYTVVNSSPSLSGSGGKNKKKNNKKSFISCWDTLSWKLTKTRTIGNKPITSFDISEDGSLLAYGSSDLSIGILDSKTLRPVLTILKCHDFPSTSIKFNPQATLLVSGSADNSLRVIKVPPPSERGGENKMTMVWLTLLILLIAVLIQQGFITKETWRAARGIMN